MGMEFTEILREAYRQVGAAELPNRLQPTALGKTIDYLVSGVGVSIEQNGTAKGEAKNGSTRVEEQDMFVKLERVLNVPVSDLSGVFCAEDGEPRLSLRPADLGSAMWSGTQKVALLVLAARQGSGIETVTPQEVLRSHVEDMKKYDHTNFSSAISGMKNLITIRGRGPKRGLVLRPKGYEAAADFIRSLSSDSENVPR